MQDLQRKTLEYYAFIWERSLGQDRQTLFPNLPKTLALQHELELKKSLIDSCDLFNGSRITRRCVLAVVRRLTPTIAIPDEVMFSQREKGDRMHFLASGTCTKFHIPNGAERSSFVQLGRLHDGDYFGEVAFFEEKNMHTYSTKTDSHCHLETLLYTDLATLMKIHTAIAEQVQTSARLQARLMRKFEDKEQYNLHFGDSPSHGTSISRGGSHNLQLGVPDEVELQQQRYLASMAGSNQTSSVHLPTSSVHLPTSSVHLPTSSVHLPRPANCDPGPGM